MILSGSRKLSKFKSSAEFEEKHLIINCSCTLPTHQARISWFKNDQDKIAYLTVSCKDDLSFLQKLKLMFLIFFGYEQSFMEIVLTKDDISDLHFHFEEIKKDLK